MDRSAYKGFANYKHLVSQYGDEGVLPQPKYFPEMVAEIGDADSLLQLIFAFDPITNSPTGDFGQFLNENVDPGVREYVKNNLLMDTSSANVAPAPDSLSDMEVFQYGRQDGESREDYASRMASVMRQSYEFIQSRKASPKEKSSESV